jgi:hypothetical protein
VRMQTTPPCSAHCGPARLRSVGVDHERAQVRLEGIEIGVAVEQVAPVRDGVGCDETVDGLADGDAEPPQCAGVAALRTARPASYKRGEARSGAIHRRCAVLAPARRRLAMNYQADMGCKPAAAESTPTASVSFAPLNPYAECPYHQSGAWRP